LVLFSFVLTNVGLCFGWGRRIEEESKGLRGEKEKFAEEKGHHYCT